MLTRTFQWLMRTLRSVPHLKRRDLLLTLLPALAWYGAYSSRQWALDPYCGKNPILCTKQHLFEMDRPAVDQSHEWANHLSFVTQDAAGYYSLAGPILVHGGLWFASRVSPGGALAGFAVDAVIALQTALWNGFFTEGTKLWVARPRPFVFRDPEKKGANPSHYTSFYSGHTSFASAASFSVLLMLMGRGVRNRWRWFAAGAWLLLTVSTGVFRVLAGVHFPTDVLAGALAGVIAAVMVAVLHRKKRDPSPEA